jgi:hypothetical protein
MNKLKLIALSTIAFVTIASTIFVSCQKQQELVITPTTKTTTVKGTRTLTKDQKLAIGWVDFGAGVCSIESGPASLVIAAAASLAFYNEKHHSEGWNYRSTYNPNNYPSSSENYGELHNLICEKYLQKGYTTVNYTDIKNVAISVKPSLEFDNLSEIQFNYFVGLIKTENTTTPLDQLKFLKKYYSINQNDEVVLSNFLVQINSDDEYRLSKIDELINRVQDFNMISNQKTHFINSLSILKNSSILWQH